MNAKELRQTAEDVQRSTDRQFAEGETAIEHAKLLAVHILATVREDDNELIAEAWLKSVAEIECAYEAYEENVVELRSGDEVRFGKSGRKSTNEYRTRSGEFLMYLKTRGDFRTLCRLLGVKLKEPSTT